MMKRARIFLLAGLALAAGQGGVFASTVSKTHTKANKATKAAPQPQKAAQPKSPRVTEAKRLVTVGKEIITNQDVLARCKLIAFLNHFPYSDEVAKEIYSQVLLKLMDEAKYEQIATQFKIIIEKSVLNENLEGVAKSFNMTWPELQQTLKKEGILESFIAMNRANIITSYIFMSAVPKDLVRFSQQQVEQRKKELEEEQKKIQYEFLEIVAYDDQIGLAKDKIQKAHAEFTELAKKHSKTRAFQEVAERSSQGQKENGYRGWVPESKLDYKTLESLKPLKPGQVSNPFCVRPGVWKIIFLHDRKMPGFEPEGHRPVTISVIFVPYSEQMSDEEKKQIERRVASLNLCTSVKEIQSVAKELGFKIQEQTAKYIQLPEEIRKLPVGTLKNGGYDGRHIVFYVVENIGKPQPLKEVPVLTNAKVEERMRGELLEKQATKKIAELSRSIPVWFNQGALSAEVFSAVSNRE